MEISEIFTPDSRVAVAFSGGVDSSVLLLLAKKYAGRVKAYFVRSAFQPDFEADDAVKVAEMLSVELETLTVDVLSDCEVTANPADRCYYCKKRIFSEILRAAQRDGFGTVAEGTNASDDISDRPGYKALQQLGIRSPLRDCGYTKAQIRQLARENSLPVADKPSYACLATRIPTGERITAELLKKTEAAETVLREAGFKNFRVRYLDNKAKLELGRGEFELLNEKRNEIFTRLSEYYDGVYLDLKERADE